MELRSGWPSEWGGCKPGSSTGGTEGCGQVRAVQVGLRQRLPGNTCFASTRTWRETEDSFSGWGAMAAVLQSGSQLCSWSWGRWKPAEHTDTEAQMSCISAVWGLPASVDSQKEGGNPPPEGSENPSPGSPGSQVGFQALGAESRKW